MCFPFFPQREEYSELMRARRREWFQGQPRYVAEFRARAFFTTDLLALELNELGALVNARDATSRIQQFLGEIPPMSRESSESPLDS